MLKVPLKTFALTSFLQVYCGKKALFLGLNNFCSSIPSGTDKY
jgi:hypothetical protein